jgi:hypothetical protein
MRETQTDTGVTGAKRQSWRRANPRDVLKRLIDKNPDLDEAQAEIEVWDIVHRDISQMRTIFEYWFVNNYRSLVKPWPRKPQTAERDRAETERAARAINEKIEEKIETKVNIRLLDMILPNGKQLRHSIREELVEFGGWMQRVAAKLLPHQSVAEAGISEDELRALYE